MATYIELFNLRNNANLSNKIATASAIKAHAILAEALPSAERKAWAENALSDPSSVVPQLIWFLLADNASATVGNITGASDSTIQTAVNDAVDKMRP